jgi:hypothetical protein
VKHVQLSQVDEFSVVVRKDGMAVITILDNVIEIQPTTEGDQVSYEADMYQLLLPWHEGIGDPANHAAYLARAKELEDPQTDGDKRIARDIVL